MSTVRVGDLYSPGRQQWPQRAEYTYDKTGHRLTLFLEDPSPQEVEAVERGWARFDVQAGKLILVFRFVFGSWSDWSDAPYEWHRVPADQRDVPSGDLERTKSALLTTVLVDAGSGIVRAASELPLPPALTTKLHAAIRAQACLPAAPSDS
ncbi:MAG TPA: hypothetical protein VG963_24285, partial [Polyangiaceae bacterium]|nr:hypothetical protein [Polyangiaceae bacterium]